METGHAWHFMNGITAGIGIEMEDGRLNSLDPVTSGTAKRRGE